MKSENGKNLGALSSKIYELLDGLENEDRTRVLKAVMQLFGTSSAAPIGDSATRSQLGVILSGAGELDRASAQQFFAHKNPENKGEMLAVAARYVEQHNGLSTIQVDDFARFFVEARQNFDRRNFVRDMKNAQNRAGFFTKGVGKGQYQLSYFGQQYVDALPDREGLKKLKRPTRRTGTKAKHARQGSV